MVADPTVGKYMVGCLTNLTGSDIKLYINQICTLLIYGWFCGYLIEWWLSCGHMYVTRTVYNHTDITYSTILMPSLSEKVAILYSNIVELFVVY